MKAHQKTIGKNDEWLTPKWILDPLGEFDLDPCAPIERPWDTAKNHYTILDDGLNKSWFGRIWCNPPFNRNIRQEWMLRMANHNNGILFVPAATETKSFARCVWGKCSGILFLKRRPHFCYVDGTRAKANSGCTISLIAYGVDNFNILRQSGLGFTLVEV